MSEPETFACPECGHALGDHRDGFLFHRTADDALCECKLTRAGVALRHLTTTSAALREALAILRQSHAIPVDSEAAAYLHGIIDQCVKHLDPVVRPTPEDATHEN